MCLLFLYGEIFLLLLFISLGIKFRASCEERELRNLKHQHHWNMIQYQGQGRIGILALHGFGVCPQLLIRGFQNGVNMVGVTVYQC